MVTVLVVVVLVVVWAWTLSSWSDDNRSSASPPRADGPASRTCRPPCAERDTLAPCRCGRPTTGGVCSECSAKEVVG